jgi:hypothetical protein
LFPESTDPGRVGEALREEEEEEEEKDMVGNQRIAEKHLGVINSNVVSTKGL